MLYSGPSGHTLPVTFVGSFTDDLLARYGLTEGGPGPARFRAPCCSKLLRNQHSSVAGLSRNRLAPSFALRRIGDARSKAAVRAGSAARPSSCSATQHNHKQQGPVISGLHPLLQRQWDHWKNLHLGSIVITPGSGRRVWWRCNECPAGHPHEWSGRVANRSWNIKSSNSSGCPYCAGQDVCLHNSLAENDTVVASQWSDANLDSPEDYTLYSNAQKLWHCDCCGLDWTAAISSRTKQKTGCPHCVSLTLKIKKQRQPAVAQSQHAMMYWDWQENKKAGLDPHELRQGSNKHAHWVCSACPKGQPHRWTTKVYSVCNAESGCPCCRGFKTCICNCLQSLFPDIAAEWDYNMNKGTPANYTAQSTRKVWWHNSKRGSFQATIQWRTQHAMRKAQA